MQLDKRFGLLLTNVTIHYDGRETVIDNVVVDTGSASTVLAADSLLPLGIKPSAQDVLYRMYGIGGSEAVYSRTVRCIQVGDRSLSDFEVDVSGMDYTIPINGLLGLDFLEAAGAVINLSTVELTFGSLPE